ncbi:tRNA dimethylallyltransferase [Pseudohyphozyma bogoriensis]|nr:tRNA dimethylallyltransferase [Pseudohyphozyma bogoriensis]
MSSAGVGSPSRDHLRNLVGVIGTTGVGKSQLAVELALAVPTLDLGRSSAPHRPTSGEIINSDSMQVYRGLDVITNKATAEEMKGVEHHLMGFLNPGDEYQVGEFQVDALAKVEALHSTDTLPVVVGGTSYYLQHLVFPNNLVSDAPPPLRPTTPTASNLSPSAPSPSPSAPVPRTIEDISHFPESLLSSILSLPAPLLELFYLLPVLPPTSTIAEFSPSFPVDSLPSEYRTAEAFASAVYAILVHVDEKSAERWHWRDVRKVRRAVDIVWEGRRWQDVLDDQSKKKDVRARYRTIIFWLFAEKDILDERLDARVDKMLERGLLAEIEELWQHQPAPDFSVGIYQAIGYKEFASFLVKREKSTTSLDGTDPTFVKGLERMKLSTRQYAKSQIQWIKKKLLPAVEGQTEPDVVVYLLDATDLSAWDQNVKQPAVELLRTFLAEEPLPNPTSLSPLAARELLSKREKTAAEKVKLTCRACTFDMPAVPRPRKLKTAPSDDGAVVALAGELGSTPPTNILSPASSVEPAVPQLTSGVAPSKVMQGEVAVDGGPSPGRSFRPPDIPLATRHVLYGFPIHSSTCSVSMLTLEDADDGMKPEDTESFKAWIAINVVTELLSVQACLRRPLNTARLRILESHSKDLDDYWTNLPLGLKVGPTSAYGVPPATGIRSLQLAFLGVRITLVKLTLETFESDTWQQLQSTFCACHKVALNTIQLLEGLVPWERTLFWAPSSSKIITLAATLLLDVATKAIGIDDTARKTSCDLLSRLVSALNASLQPSHFDVAKVALDAIAKLLSPSASLKRTVREQR